jgi:hypothetical protein
VRVRSFAKLNYLVGFKIGVGAQALAKIVAIALPGPHDSQAGLGWPDAVRTPFSGWLNETEIQHFQKYSLS